MKDETLLSKMEGKTNFSRLLKQFDGLTRLDTPVFYDQRHGFQQTYQYSSDSVGEGAGSSTDSTANISVVVKTFLGLETETETWTK